MTRASPFAHVVMAATCAFSMLSAQTPAPALTQRQKEAAAGVESPKTFLPPPAPGELQGSATVKPAGTAQAPNPVSATPSASTHSASKTRVLEAVTQRPQHNEAPRVTAPADKLPVTTSTSTSGQFIVHGKVFATRSAMSSRCEEVSQELRKVLDDREPWGIPVVVVLNTGDDALKSQGPPVSTGITEMTHGGFHLQVTVNERPGLNAADLRREVVRVLLAERILRGHQKLAVPEGRLLLPDWVMTGVLQAMDYKAATRPSAMFATIFRSGKIYGIEEIISASPTGLDGLSRSIYETSCCALVLALVDQPSGAQHFNKFLNSLATDPRSERDLLDLAFPKFAASASSLNKWWSLQLATLSKPGIAERLTPADSLKAIEEAIQIRYKAKPSEVPKNIKLHPFILPPPLAVASSDEPPPPTPVTGGPPQAKSKEQQSENKTAESLEKPKRPLWRRLLFLGAAPVTDAKPQDGKKTEEASVPTTKPDTVSTEDEDKPGFFGRLFGFGSDGKKEDVKQQPPPRTPEKTPDAKPTKSPPTESEPTKKTDDEKKPSLLNPLNWFRGSNGKDEAKPKEDKPEKNDKTGEQTSSPAPHTLDWPRLIAPLLADAWQLLPPLEPRLTAGKPLFDFLKKKSVPQDTEKPRTENKEPGKKPRAQTETSPSKKTRAHTTNPNAKPATKKPADSPPGQPHTTNPNAKPVPGTVVKPAPDGTLTPATAASSTELISVTLPLEEYQHVMRRTDRALILNANVSALRALDMRVATLFRPVVNAYLAAVLDIQSGKTSGMDKRLAAIHQFALVAHQKSVAVRDYLDWFEASESGHLSGKFDDFLNLPKIIEQELPPRADPISKYLDAIDKEFSK